MYVLGFFMLLGATVAQQGAPLALRYAIDSIEGSIGGGGATVITLLGYAAIILTLAAVEGFLRYRSRHMVSGSARHVEYALRDDMARQLLNIDQRFFVNSAPATSCLAAQTTWNGSVTSPGP